MTKKAYDKAFIGRVRVARESAGLTRIEISAHMGIKPDSYARYEKRTMLPHYLIPPFCRATGVSLEYLLGATKRKKPNHLKSV